MLEAPTINFRTEVNNAKVTDEHQKIIADFAEKNGLNIEDKHVTGFLDKHGVVSAVVKYDGWIHLLNKTSEFDGLDFNYSETSSIVPGTLKSVYNWIECVIYRKDRTHPIVVREHFGDLFSVEHDYWEKPNRVMRQIALSECARVAFGISGIRDEYSLPTLEGVISNGSKLVSTNFEKPVRVIDVVPPSNNVVPIKDPASVEESVTELSITTEAKDLVDKFISSLVQHPAVFSTPNTVIDQLGTRFSGVSLEYAVKVYKQALNDFQQNQGALQ